MNKFFAFLISGIISFQLSAQIKDPVKWTATARKAQNGHEIVITATMPKPWHIYSQFTGDGGPVATNFSFSKNPLVSLEGNVKEVGTLKEQFDKLFDTKVKYFGEKVQFIQQVKVKGNVKTNMNITVEYMTCDDTQCLPPTKKTFTVSL